MTWAADNFVGDLPEAIAQFYRLLPGWWFSVGVCHVSADATCAPDTAGCDGHLAKLRFFDEGFSADIMPPATMADALRAATEMAMVARAAYRIYGTEDAARRAVAGLGIAYEPRAALNIQQRVEKNG